MNPANERSKAAAPKTRSLEALAFYLAAHRIHPDTVADEVDARFDSEFAVETHAVTERLRKLEGRLDEVRRKLPGAEGVWDRVQGQIGDTPPSTAEALMMAAFATFTLALDAIFIAPSMDLLSVADPALQFVAASGLAVFSTLYFHMAGSVLLAGKTTRLMKVAAGVAGVGGVLALTVWGMLRGYQLGFSALLQGNPLGQFLAAHPLLSSIFYTFITVATPLVGAAASIHAWKSLRIYREWRRAHDAYEKLHTTEAHLMKDIQLAKDEIAHLAALTDARRKEWKAVVAQYYGRGASHGARQESAIVVHLKSVLVALGTLGGLLFVPFIPVVTAFAAAAVAGCGAYAVFNHRRIHPNHERYLRHENTQFAVPDKDHEQRMPEPAQRLLTKGDE